MAIPWRSTFALALLVASAFLAWEALLWMFNDWNSRPEYSYGMLVPAIVGYLLWQRRGADSYSRTGQSVGYLLLLGGVFAVVLGNLATIFALSQFGFVVCLIGIFGVMCGWPALKNNIAPLAMLLLMIPLPYFLHRAVSGELQLLSSEIGTAVLKLVGISVYLEGNVIDLGNYKLQVVEACAGLRYLFPLLSLNAIIAYLFLGPLWQRLLLFVSAVPFTVALNSLRIAIVGLLVENHGTEMAEGFLHDFQGWAVFMLSLLLTLLLAKILTRVSGSERVLVEHFMLDSTGLQNAAKRHALTGTAYLSAATLMLAIVLTHTVLAPPKDIALERKDFLSFPNELQQWQGRRLDLDPQVLSVLQLDDYLAADYQDVDGTSVNLYMAYYRSQLSGQSVHSPRSCLPGDGWEIESLQVTEIDGQVLNRAVITKGPNRQLVYYWFEQRGQTLANEYAVKWNLLRDAVVTGRTDGGMVRMVTAAGSERDFSAADARLTALFRQVKPLLPSYMPG